MNFLRILVSLSLLLCPVAAQAKEEAITPLSELRGVWQMSRTPALFIKFDTPNEFRTVDRYSGTNQDYFYFKIFRVEKNAAYAFAKEMWNHSWPNKQTTLKQFRKQKPDNLLYIKFEFDPIKIYAKPQTEAWLYMGIMSEYCTNGNLKEEDFSFTPEQHWQRFQLGKECYKDKNFSPFTEGTSYSRLVPWPLLPEEKNDTRKVDWPPWGIW